MFNCVLCFYCILRLTVCCVSLCVVVGCYVCVIVCRVYSGVVCRCVLSFIVCCSVSCSVLCCGVLCFIILFECVESHCVLSVHCALCLNVCVASALTLGSVVRSAPREPGRNREHDELHLQGHIRPSLQVNTWFHHDYHYNKLPSSGRRIMTNVLSPPPSQGCHRRDPSHLHRGDRRVDEDVQRRLPQRQLPEIRGLDSTRSGTEFITIEY